MCFFFTHGDGQTLETRLFRGQSVACDRNFFFLFFFSFLLLPSLLSVCSKCPVSISGGLCHHIQSLTLPASPHLLTRKPPIHRNLQANQRRRGQKYSKWNC